MTGQQLTLMPAEPVALRALTLTQPWCGLVASGIKLIENRPREVIGKAMIGQRIALHASRVIDKAVWARIAELGPELVTATHGGALPDPPFPWTELASVTSAIIGTAVVAKVYAGSWDEATIAEHRDVLAETIAGITGRRDQLRWFFGPVAYVLRDVRALAVPVSCKGALGLWRVPAELAAQVTGRTAV
jgi:hypothetical protein